MEIKPETKETFLERIRSTLQSWDEGLLQTSETVRMIASDALHALDAPEKN